MDSHNRNPILDAILTGFPQLENMDLSQEAAISGARKCGKKNLWAKICIGSLIMFLLVIILGYILLPSIINSTFEMKLSLRRGSESRATYIKLPFALDFKIYIFNITNPLEVIKGASPVLDEIGPYYFELWREKVNLMDNEVNDELSFNNKLTWIFKKQLSYPGLTGEEIVTIPHAIMLSIAVTVARQKPAMLSLVNKALNAIFEKPTTPFMTAPVMDILFSGVIVNCSTTNFAGKATCGQLRTEAKDLQHISDTIFKFSIFGKKNGSADEHRFTVRKGVHNLRDVGLVVAYDGAQEISTWPVKQCNQFLGTEATIFPPFMIVDEGVPTFIPELCRSIISTYDGETKFKDISVHKYIVRLGDTSNDKSLQCFCPLNASCWKQGLHDLTRCMGAPFVASQPHFYDSHPVYVNGVKGLRPEKEQHGIVAIFETTTGIPVYARKRLQLSLPLMPVEKLDIMKSVPETLVPFIWIEEGLNIPDEYAEKIVSAYNLFNTIKTVKLTILIISLTGIIVAGYLHYNFTDTGSVAQFVKRIKTKARPAKNIITVFPSNTQEYNVQSPGPGRH